MGDDAFEAVLAGEHDGLVGVGAAVTVGEGVLGVVQGGAGKPVGAGHGVGPERRGGGVVEPDVEEVRGGGPEGADVGHGPGVQGGVVGAVGEVDAPLLAQEAGESRDLARRRGVRRGGPHDVGGSGCHDPEFSLPQGRKPVTAGVNRTS